MCSSILFIVKDYSDCALVELPTMLDQLLYARSGRCTGVRTPVELDAMFLRGLGILFLTPILSAYSLARLFTAHAMAHSLVGFLVQCCFILLVRGCPCVRTEQH